MEHKECPLCAGPEIIRMKNYEKCYLSKCTSCSFVFTYKIPEKQELKNYYRTYGLSTCVPPVTIKRYNEILNGFKKYRHTNKILDIGCGAGYFLEEAKEHGWNTYGVEYSDEAINVCKGKGINIIDIEESYAIQIKDFDIIMFTEVIEHLSYPKIYLNLISDRIRHGGLLYITTPNFNSISRILTKNNWPLLNYPEHLSFYTVKTLKKELAGLNFKLVYVKTHGLSLSQMKRSKKNSEEKYPEIYKNVEDEKIREFAEKRPIFRIIKNIINYLLNLAKKGDTIKCMAIKN